MITLPTLAFESTSLEPYMSAKTLEFHYGKHHRGYVDNLNNLIKDIPTLNEMSLENILLNINTIPQEIRTPIFNNAAQIYNHNIFWSSLSDKKDQTPQGSLLEAINKTFDSYDNFKKLWKQAGISQFGSGWVWLVSDQSDNLSIVKTSNANTPLTDGLTPLLTMDVWEHAYYLDYQNRRPDYIDNYFRVINWELAGQNYEMKSIK
jgi:superoxide dismutase, Fe-Mn family